MTMEREISITYTFNPADYDARGRKRNSGTTFRDAVKKFERDFHQVHPSDYALNLYANSHTMSLLARSCYAAPHLLYGMDLPHGRSFDPEQDPYINHEMDRHSRHIYVYGIDSAFMTEFAENGYPILDEDSDIYPLTLLVDDTMRDDAVRLAAPTLDDGNSVEDVNINLPIFEYA